MLKRALGVEVRELVCLLAMLATLGCGSASPSFPAMVPAMQPPTPPSHVERGELFVAGAELYDEYFALVFELQAHVATLQLEERKVLAPLAGMLGLLPTATRTRIVERLASGPCPSDASFLSSDREVGPAAGGPTCRMSPASGGRRVVAVMRATLGRESKLASKMNRVPVRAERLRALARTLTDSVAWDLAMHAEERRNQVHFELERSMAVLESIRDEAARESVTMRAFVWEARARQVFLERVALVGGAGRVLRQAWEPPTHSSGR